ncbi:MAG: DUF4835 family protein [Chitinophagales bacterium]|nr:DUF4835 family protein [Chitinophagales bacterium]
MNLTSIFYHTMKSRFAAMMAAMMFFSLQLTAQEINCNLTVSSTMTGNNVDPKVFKTLERSLLDFINSRKWTDENFADYERVNCTFFINIKENPSENVYVAELTIQSSRPVFNSSYQTQVVKHIDQDFVFQYKENDPLEFSDNIYINNLSSMMGFYVYLILGYDYDCFSPKGGTKFFEKADNIANIVPFNANVGGQSISGWKQTDSRGVGAQKNRYWIINNLLNTKNDNIRKCFYKYHLQGLDLLYNKGDEARKNILSALTMLQEANSSSLLYITTIFMSAKSDEIINIFKGAPADQRKTLLEKIQKLDGINIERYNKVLK